MWIADDDEIDAAVDFIDQLVGLERATFASAMRALQRVVRAAERAADDPTLAYAMFVASMESLTTEATGVPLTWDRFDGRKRRILDPTLKDLDQYAAERIREAIMLAEHAGATQRFVSFVEAHIEPPYWRDEAVHAVRPLPAHQLHRVLRRAYQIRSKNLHELESLPPEAWVFTERAESVSPAGRSLILSLEGLNRLSRHVITRFVYRAPQVEQEDYDYRAALPGILRMQLAPQYWLHSADGFSHVSAPRYLHGLIEVLVEVIRDGGPMPVDMRAVLERIERDAFGAPAASMRAMAAIYELWHGVLDSSVHRPQAAQYRARLADAFVRPSIEGVAVAVLLSVDFGWTVEDLAEYATRRKEHRNGTDEAVVTAEIEAALWAELAADNYGQGDAESARAALANAVEELPGNARLIEAESGLLFAGEMTLDVRALVLQVPVGSDGGENV